MDLEANTISHEKLLFLCEWLYSNRKVEKLRKKTRFQAITWCKNISNQTCGTTLWIHCHHFKLQSRTWWGCSDFLMPPFMLAVLILTNRTITHICWCTLLLGVNLTSCATQLLESLCSALVLVLTSPSIPGLMCRFCLSGYPYHSGEYYSGYSCPLVQIIRCFVQKHHQRDPCAK